MSAPHRLAALLPADPVRVTPVGGGCICAAYRVELADGRTVFVKERADAPEGFFDTEAAGLRWLAGAGPAAAPTPAVVSVHPQALVLDWVAAGAATPAAAEHFGRALAATHAAGAASFGGPRDGWIGSAPLSNTPADTWAQFYARERVLPYLREAADRQAIAAGDSQTIETAVARIDDLGGPAEPPARIHGDLWSGNVHWAGRTAARGSSTPPPTEATGKPTRTLRCWRCSAPRIWTASSPPTTRPTHWRTGGSTGWRCTSCTPCWYMPCSSAANTRQQRRRPRPPGPVSRLAPAAAGSDQTRRPLAARRATAPGAVLHGRIHPPGLRQCPADPEAAGPVPGIDATPFIAPATVCRVASPDHLGRATRVNIDVFEPSQPAHSVRCSAG